MGCFPETAKQQQYPQQQQQQQYQQQQQCLIKKKFINENKIEYPQLMLTKKTVVNSFQSHTESSSRSGERERKRIQEGNDKLPLQEDSANSLELSDLRRCNHDHDHDQDQDQDVGGNTQPQSESQQRRKEEEEEEEVEEKTNQAYCDNFYPTRLADGLCLCQHRLSICRDDQRSRSQRERQRSVAALPTESEASHSASASAPDPDPAPAPAPATRSTAAPPLNVERYALAATAKQQYEPLRSSGGRHRPRLSGNRSEKTGPAHGLQRVYETLAHSWTMARRNLRAKMSRFSVAVSLSLPLLEPPCVYNSDHCQIEECSSQHHRQRRRRRNRLRDRRLSALTAPSSSDSSYSCSSHNSPSIHGSASESASASASASPLSASAAFNYIGHNYYNLLRNSISFYAASSVILVLCYLTTATSATAAANSDSSSSTSSIPIDKHPIQSIDWSKFDESSSDKEILDLLLEKKRYDKRLLPPVNDEDFCCGLSSPDMAISSNARRPHNRGTLTVNVNVLLLSLASPDESSLKYEVEFLLNQQWNDPRLQYGNKSHYDFLNALHHHDSIWTPDTYFIMHGDFKDPIIPMHFALRIYRNGTITYAMRRHLILSCQGSLHIFPFDDPKCSFSMESISYEEAQIKYVWKNDEDTLRKSPSLTTLNAYLIKNQTTACDQNSWRGNYSCLRVDLIFTRDRAFYFTTVFIPGIILVTSSFITFWLEWNAVPARSMIGNYSCLQVELTFTRDRAYYFTTVFIPGIILVTSSFITFWLEWNAVPARVMIGVTTMLNFFTTSNGFRSTLPVVSNLTAMNVWDGVCMCFIYASLLEFVCVNYVGRKRPLHNVVYRPGENPVIQRLPAVLSRIGVILASPLATTGVGTVPVSVAGGPAGRPTAGGGGGGGAGGGMGGGGGGSSSMTMTPRQQAMESVGPGVRKAPPCWVENEQQQSPATGGIITAAVQTLRDYTIKRRKGPETDTAGQPRADLPQSQPIPDEPIYSEPMAAEPHVINPSAPDHSAPEVPPTRITVEHEKLDTTTGEPQTMAELSPERYRSISTNTPPLILRSEKKSTGASADKEGGDTPSKPKDDDIEMAEYPRYPLRPPRKKSSRSTSPAAGVYDADSDGAGAGAGIIRRRLPAMESATPSTAPASDIANGHKPEGGEKRRDVGTGGPNEIVACTTCGGSNSPCTHSANNGCATETCFVQVRKKEPPHPIRVAKTIDVIARITFPTAYAIFLIFFFVHYKGFS